MKDRILVDDELLIKFFAGEATPEEAIAISAWIELSKENKSIYAELESAWHFGNAPSTPSSEEEWEKLQSVLVKQKGVTKLISLRFSYRIAATILLFLTAGLVAYYFTTPVAVEELAHKKRTLKEVASVTLADGTSVIINRNSTLQWPQNMNGEKREVHLEGEAFFDVAHNPEKPFIVTTNEVHVKVLGTAFNVANTDTATVTEVIRGKVMMYTENEEIVIEAGMMGIYNRAAKTLQLTKLSHQNSIAYVTHSLVFEGATVKEVCLQLSKTYGVKFVLADKLENCTFTSEYHNKSLKFILDVFTESLNLTYEIKDDTVYVFGEGCL